MSILEDIYSKIKGISETVMKLYAESNTPSANGTPPEQPAPQPTPTETPTNTATPTTRSDGPLFDAMTPRRAGVSSSQPVWA